MTTDVLLLTAKIAAAYASNPNHNGTDPLRVVRIVADTLGGLRGNSPATSASMLLAGSPNQNAGKATPDILSCLECGMRMKMLKRHLLTVHDLTPDQYRIKHNLPADEPMVTSNYARLRSEIAKANGLGRRR